MPGADVIIALRGRLGQDRRYHVLGRARSQRSRVVLVSGGDLPGLLAYLLPAEPEPLQCPRRNAVVLACQANQEMPRAPMGVAEPAGLPPGKTDRMAAGAGERQEPGGPGVDACSVLACQAEGGCSASRR